MALSGALAHATTQLLRGSLPAARSTTAASPLSYHSHRQLYGTPTADEPSTAGPWAEAKAGILRDVEPVVDLVKDIIHSRRCVLARELWFSLLSPVGLEALVPARDENIARWWLHQRRRLHSTSCPAFDTTLLLIAWALWKERNARTFCHESSMIHHLVAKTIREAEEWIETGFGVLSLAVPLWVQNYVTM